MAFRPLLFNKFDLISFDVPDTAGKPCDDDDDDEVAC